MIAGPGRPAARRRRHPAGADVRPRGARRAAQRLESLGLVVNVTEPAHTTAAAEAALPQMQMISSWTTYYVPSDGNGYGANINIGAFDIDGRNLYPGEWFSFWESIGPVTLERGYATAARSSTVAARRAWPSAEASAPPRPPSSTPRCAPASRWASDLNHYYYIDRYPMGSTRPSRSWTTGCRT